MMAQDRPGLIQRIEQQAGQHLRDGMEAIRAGRHHPEAAPAAAQPPEEVRVLRRARRHEVPSGGHHLRRQHVIGHQAVFAHQRTVAAAQREAGQPDAGDGARGRRQAVAPRRVDEVARPCAALGAGRVRRGVDGDGAHPRAIDHDAILAQRPSREIMSPAANGERTPMRARPTNGVSHVLGMRTANDRRRTGVDPPIPELARRLIGRVLGEDERAGEELCEILENGTAAALCGCHGFFRSWRVLLCSNASCRPHHLQGRRTICKGGARSRPTSESARHGERSSQT